MIKLKLNWNWIIIGVGIIFILSTLILSVQKGALVAKQKKFQTNLDGLLATQNELKKQLGEANAKLSTERKLIVSLKESLEKAKATIQMLNIDKQALREQIEALQGEVIIPPPEIPELPGIIIPEPETQ